MGLFLSNLTIRIIVSYPFTWEKKHAVSETSHSVMYGRVTESGNLLIHVIMQYTKLFNISFNNIEVI
jgi:hypothetical protein